VSHRDLRVLVLPEKILEHDEPLDHGPYHFTVQVRVEFERVSQSLALDPKDVISGGGRIRRQSVPRFPDLSVSPGDEDRGDIENPRSCRWRSPRGSLPQQAGHRGLQAFETRRVEQTEHPDARSLATVGQEPRDPLEGRAIVGIQCLGPFRKLL
jgi:hypothetical protein